MRNKFVSIAEKTTETQSGVYKVYMILDTLREKVQIPRLK